MRDPAETLTDRGGEAAGGEAPFAAARGGRIHLFRGALLSATVHASLILLILFGLPVIVLNLAREPSEPDPRQNLSMALVIPEEAKDLAPAAVDRTPSDPRRGSRFLADAPADKPNAEKADVPTTLGAADATVENDSTTGNPPTPTPAQTERADPAPDRPPQESVPQKVSPPQQAVPPQESARLSPTEPSRVAPRPVQLTADTPATSRPAASKSAAAESPPRAEAAESTAQPAAESRTAQASLQVHDSARAAGASAATPHPTPLPAVASPAGPPPPPQSSPPSRAATPSPPVATAKTTPPPKPRTPGEVVAQLAAELPRIAAIRAELRQAEKRPPGAEAPAPEGSQPVERLQEFAEQGYGHAQFALAEMLLTGEGLPRDAKKGLALATRAALNGYLPAQILLGALAADGSVGERNLGEADAWWTLAAGNGSKQAAEAVKAIKPMLEVRDIVTSRKRQAELHKISAVLSPFSGTKLTAKAAGDKLRQAAALGDVDTVSVLLAQGADADSSDEDGRTALIEAAWRGYVNIVQTLAQQGANLGQTDSSGKTPLVWAAINGHADVTKVLLDAGENPDLQDKDGIDALMRAAWNDRPTVVRELLAHNANPNLRDKTGMTALDFATRYGHPAIAALLRGVTR